MKSPMIGTMGPRGEVLIYKEDSGGFLIVYNGKQKRLKDDLYYDIHANFEFARLISGIIEINENLLKAMIESL
jgi:hypothetical protein